MTGSERLDKPYKKTREGPSAHNDHPAKCLAYSEAPENSAEALKSKRRADVRKLFKAYLILSQEKSSDEDVSAAFKTLISACQGVPVVLYSSSP
jgi:hypothetical protein